MATFPIRPPEMLEAIRGAYVRGTMPARLIGVMFGLSTGELYPLVRRHR